MLSSLKFAQGAIKKNGISPELEHYTIKDGRVTGFNGYMALSAPIDLDIEAMPNAAMFFKALQACGDTVAISKTPSGRLHIQSGKFSAYIPCLEKEIYEAVPSGTEHAAPAGMAAAFAKMLPFISDDASRPWAMGLSIGNGCYTATNNVVLLQQWAGHDLPQINCPRFAVAEVARLRRDPVSIKVDGHSLSFIYDDGSWLRTQLLDQAWPLDRMSQIMDRPANLTPIPEGFYEAVAKLAPFAAEASSPIFMSPAGLSTIQSEADDGVRFAMEGLPEAAFRLKAVQMLDGIMTGIDWTQHPNPCIFAGEACRGALIGMTF